MPPTAVSLARMVDLAVGTPEAGAVNFNVLHSLLHAVLQRLNIADVKADLPELEDADNRGQTRDSGLDNISSSKSGSAAGGRDLADIESDSGVTGLPRSASEIGVDPEKVSGLEKSKTIPITRFPYHALEEKVERLEQQLAALEALPSTKELMEMTSGGSDQRMDKVPRPVAEMWQSMQLSRKVDANTQGVSKVSHTTACYSVSVKL
jgi:glutamine-rich protein 2